MQEHMWLAAMGCMLAIADVYGPWDDTGRATFYDDGPNMSLHDGSCMFGYLGNRLGKSKEGWMITAITNNMHEDYIGSCGRCYEVKCRPAGICDGLGAYLDRTKDCTSNQTVTVAVTDKCPCYKESNVLSNRRWCCGDAPHFDLSVWAFSKMARPGKGVIPISFRKVPCPPELIMDLGPDQTPSSLKDQYPWDLVNIRMERGE